MTRPLSLLVIEDFQSVVEDTHTDVITAPLVMTGDDNQLLSSCPIADDDLESAILSSHGPEMWNRYNVIRSDERDMFVL